MSMWHKPTQQTSIIKKLIRQLLIRVHLLWLSSVFPKGQKLFEPLSPPFQCEVRGKDEALPITVHGAKRTVQQQQLHPATLDKVHLVAQRQLCVACHSIKQHCSQTVT